MTPGTDPDILQQVQQLIRRDLKLSATEPLPPEMPLFGSDIDLDSLDMLLLVTSLERTFGVRVPNEAIGKEVFHSVGAMARYVQANRGTAPPAAPVAATVPASQPEIDWLARLPHGAEFRFISRVLDVQRGRSARAVWQLVGTEPFFAAHFPGNPLVPGVLIGEAMAQTAGIAAAPADGPFAATLAQLDLRFERPVRPPAEIELSANLVNTTDGGLFRFDVMATSAAVVVARGSLTLHHAGE